MRKVMSAAVRNLERAAVDLCELVEGGCRLARVQQSAFVELDPVLCRELAVQVRKARNELAALRYSPQASGAVETEKKGDLND